ncbi:MAG: DUF3040 domain-containing protein [Streptosporangiaceae bacterium]|nr:DUF3040 domain-containing protein [Streptosporangiaceae bacterium]
MSLPASQQRALDEMEQTLQASEPRLASMFAIFARLAAGDGPVAAEPLASRSRWWLPRGTTGYAFVLVPVIFVMIIAGVLLGRGGHSVGSCAAGYSGVSGTSRVYGQGCATVGGHGGNRAARARGG